MKREIILLLVIVLLSAFGWSQTGIGVESPNDEAVLEIASSTKGVLLPKVALDNSAQTFHLTDAAAAAHTGMLLYNTNTDVTGGLSGVGYYYWTGTQWERMVTTDGSSNIFFPNPGDFDLSQPQPTSALLGVLGNPQGRLRLTAGLADTFDDSLGASIDLHGNFATSNTGVLDLVAGSAASATNNAIRFWTNSDGFNGQDTRMVITGNGNVGIGNATPNANAILDLTNTDADKALLLPAVAASANVTTPVAGMVVYENTNNNMLVYNGTEWVEPFNQVVVTNEQIFDGVDEGSGTYDDFYYISMLINNAWQVTRYSRSNVNVEQIANVGNNSSQTTQPATVAICVALNYQTQ